jgi:chloride channel protein, CIC family
VLQPVPILEQFTHQDGLDLPSMEEVREESNLHLEDAMQPVTVPVLQGSDNIADTIESLAQYEDGKAAPVVLIHCIDGLWYAARREELEALFNANAGDASAGSPDNISVPPTERPALTLQEYLGPERTPVLFPDLPLSSALPHFQRWPLLPITNRAVRGSLEGVVSLQNVLDRYQQQHSRGH